VLVAGVVPLIRGHSTPQVQDGDSAVVMMSFLSRQRL
jgi:hypothetical protein